jgi:hypothetical protein
MKKAASCILTLYRRTKPLSPETRILGTACLTRNRFPLVFCESLGVAREAGPWGQESQQGGQVIPLDGDKSARIAGCSHK